VLIYAAPRSRHRGHSKARAVAVVFDLNSPDRSHRQPYSRTRLFFDDGHDMLFFTRKVYTMLACGAPNRQHTGALLDVSGTIMYGQTARPHGRKINLHNDEFRLRVFQGTPLHGQVRYSLRVEIARLNYSEIFTGLQGGIIQS